MEAPRFVIQVCRVAFPDTHRSSESPRKIVILTSKNVSPSAFLFPAVAFDDEDEDDVAAAY